MSMSLEPLLAEFDKAWRSGLAPKVDEFVQRVPAVERSALLEELVPIDLEYRWRTYSSAGAEATARLRAGSVPVVGGADSDGIPSHPALEHYQRHFPELGSSEDCSPELIAAEYFARKRWGDRPAMQEYFLRFPGRDAELNKALGDVDAELARECGAAARSNGAARQGALTQMRCPRCRRRVDRPDAAGSDVTCPACGDRFAVPEPAAAPFLQLGRYRVDEKLGAGGFGTVWKAWDTELQREVAVKLPRNGRFASAEEEERFLREARAAAGLRHEGIIPIFDAGQHNQTLFIVADLVRGKNLEEWITAERLSVRESAELVAQVAEALDYAHRHGVVHRDLKPANIMLDLEERTMAPATGGSKRPSGWKAEGREALKFRPKVMDFGLAKWSGSAVTVTLDGEVFGTPGYMSPEQIRDSHQADARSDVYSLGVILYELLTGEIPFRGQAAMVMEQVQREEPRRPRRLDQRIPVDLETICLKCLAKEPAGRYASAEALAEDLRRFLAGEPILARPAGAAERAWRWARRRPGIAGLSAAVAAMILFIVVGSLAFALRLAKEKNGAEAARQAAEKSADDAREAQAQAETSGTEARRAARAADDARKDSDRARQQADEDRRQALQSVYALIRVVDRQLANAPNTQKPREGILRRMVAELERLDKNDGGREVRHLLITAHTLLGDVLNLRAADEEAHQEFERAHAVGEALVKDAAPDDRCRCDLADACLRLGSSHQERGDRAEARRCYDRAEALLEGWEKNGGQAHLEVNGRRGIMHSRLGDLCFDGSDFPAAIAEYEKAHHHLKPCLAANPAHYASDVAMTLDRIGKAHLMNNNVEAAEVRMRAALAILTGEKPNGGWDLRQLRLYQEVYGDLGNVCLRRGKHAEARKFFEDQVRMGQGLIRMDSGNIRQRRALSMAYLQLAEIRLRDGDPDIALAGARNALALLRDTRVDTKAHYRLKVEFGMVYEQLGTFYLYYGAAAAKDCLEDADKLRTELVAANPENRVFRIQLADTALKLGRYHERVHDYAEAARAYRVTIDRVRVVLARADADTQALFQASLAMVENSLAFCETVPKAVEDMKSALGRPPRDVAMLLTARTAVLCQRGRAAEAVATAEKLSEVAAQDGDSQYNLACALALCAAAAPEVNQAKLRDRAVVALRRASELGFKDVAQMTTDPDLAAIREHPDYAALVKKLKPTE